MKEKINIVLDKISLIVLCIIIILLNVFIGSNIKEPLYGIQLFITIFSVIYIIVKKIVSNKNVILKDKIDFVVLFFMLATCLPLIFKTYVSLNDTIQFILKYFSIYGIYILARNVLNKKRTSILVNVMIFSSILIIIFGIDKFFNYNIFINFLDKINAVKIDGDRFISIFGYANTVALYLSSMLFLALAQYKKYNNKIIKISYVLYICVNIICIILTQSKSIIAVILVIGAIQIIKKAKTPQNILKLILIGIICLIIFGTYFIVAINIPKNLEITENQKICVIKGLEKNKEYDFTFQIEAQSEKEYNTFEIEVVEINRYLHGNVLKRIEFSSFSDKKNIHLKTSELHSHIEIRIKNKLQEDFKITSFWIDGKPYILEYKYIKDALVRLIKDFNLKYPSVWQRGDYYKDGLKIVEDNFLLGAGGNAWRNLYKSEQEYSYSAKEAHSYPLEVSMSFGILGICSYIGIIASVLYKMIKTKKEDDILYKTTTLVLLLMFGLSIIDFHFSFFIMLALLFIMIAMVHEENKILEENKIFNIFEYGILICLILVSFGNAKMTYVKYFIKDDTYKTQTNIAQTDSNFLYNRIKWLIRNNAESQDVINCTLKYIDQEFYKNQNEMYEILLNEIFMDINENNFELRLQEIEKLANVLKNRKRSSKYDISEIRQKANLMVQFSRILNENADKFENQKLNEISINIAQQVIDEYDEGVELISQYQKTGEYKSITEMQLESYKIILEEAKKMLEINRGKNG